MARHSRERIGALDVIDAKREVNVALLALGREISEVDADDSVHQELGLFAHGLANLPFLEFGGAENLEPFLLLPFVLGALARRRRLLDGLFFLAGVGHHLCHVNPCATIPRFFDPFSSEYRLWKRRRFRPKGFFFHFGHKPKNALFHQQLGGFLAVLPVLGQTPFFLVIENQAADLAHGELVTALAGVIALVLVQVLLEGHGLPDERHEVLGNLVRELVFGQDFAHALSGDGANTWDAVLVAQHEADFARADALISHLHDQRLDFGTLELDPVGGLLRNGFFGPALAAGAAMHA